MTFTRVKMYCDGAYITEALFVGNIGHVSALERFHKLFPSASDHRVNLVAQTVDIDTDSDYFKSCLWCGAVY